MARPAKPPDPQSNTHDPVPPALRYTPSVLRLDQVDAQTMRHIYCHRDGPSMAWNDDKDATPDNLKSLGESLLAEGQVVPIEFYRDGERNILVRGYRLIEAL